MASSYLSALALVVCLGLAQCQEFDFDRGFDEPDARDQTVQECRGKVMDIFFVLDSSTSIWENDVERERQFVRDAVTLMDISASATRVGILTFSNDIQRPVLGLNNFQVKSEVLASVNVQNLPHRTGITNTDTAIRYVRENTEFREDITKVIVVITDGGSRAPGATAREAELARENGFYLFVVGVGQYLDEREWRAIASDPDEQFIYNITNFRFLSNVRNSLVPRACLLPPIILGRCAVAQPADLYFAAETSATNNAFTLLDYFADRTTDNLDQVRINVYMDACNNAQDITLEEIDSYCDRFYDASASEPTPYRDLIAQARNAARAARERGENRNQVAVLFVDEQTMRANRFDFGSEARALQRDGVELIVVDLGVRSYVSALQGLSQNRNNYIRFQPGSVADQGGAERRMLEASCAALNFFIIDGPGPN